MKKELDVSNEKQPTSPASAEKNRFSKKMALYGVIGLLVVIISFIGGMQFQKGRGDDKVQQTPRDILNLRSPDSFTGRGMRHNAGISTVTAVSETSISVKNQRDNAETTYAINGDTRIISKGTDATYNDIKVGDKVMVTASSQSDDAAGKTAERILLDPPVAP